MLGDMNMSQIEYLSPHFSFLEMTRTDNRKYIEQNRVVTPELLATGKILCESLLEPIRAHFGHSVVVHSGYRCPALNTAIGGSKTSQHKLFQACDFHVDGVDMTETWNWIWKESGLKFGQVILEGFSKSYPHPGWVHISLGAPYRDVLKCGQVMTYSEEFDKYTTVATIH